MELSSKANESDHKVIRVHGGLSMRLNARTSEKIAFALLSLAALTVAGFVVIILAYIIYNGYSAISVEFLTEMPQTYDDSRRDLSGNCGYCTPYHRVNGCSPSNGDYGCYLP